MKRPAARKEVEKLAKANAGKSNEISEQETEEATEAAKETTGLEIVVDEICEDEEYDSNVDESVTENIEPEGEMHLSEETLKENLKNVGIKPLKN